MKHKKLGRHSGFQAYQRRILDYIGSRDPLQMLAAAPRQLERLLKGASPRQLSRRSAPGKWSVRAIVKHLADVELVYGFRTRLILGERRARIGAFDQDRWAKVFHYERADMKSTLRDFQVLRKMNVALLRRIPRASWKKFGIHEERGKETLGFMIKLLAGHDANHFQQIRALLSPGATIQRSDV